MPIPKWRVQHRGYATLETGKRGYKRMKHKIELSPKEARIIIEALDEWDTHGLPKRVWSTVSGMYNKISDIAEQEDTSE
tara:strand:+ start:182 stop:418 length:237 start_codon:yes stop_codon:yes gene_type:complete